MRAHVGIAAAVGLCLAGMAGGASAQVKIGAVLSVTGPASFLGDPEKKTLKLMSTRSTPRAA